MRRLTVSVLLTACLVIPARAACDEDTINTVSEDGDLIILTSGSSYDVDGADQSTAAGWQEGDDESDNSPAATMEIWCIDDLANITGGNSSQKVTAMG